MLIEAKTLAEWRDTVANRADLPFAPPPFELFMADESEDRCTVGFSPTGAPDWLSAEVRRRPFGDSFDLEIGAVAVHGPARDAFDRAIADGQAPVVGLVGTGLFRDFMATAEALSRNLIYAAVVCHGVANPALRPVLTRYGYRQFASMDFRKILRSPAQGGQRSLAGTFYGRALERFGAGA
jgi:hypothetical protein